MSEKPEGSYDTFGYGGHGCFVVASIVLVAIFVVLVLVISARVIP